MLDWQVPISWVWSACTAVRSIVYRFPLYSELKSYCPFFCSAWFQHEELPLVLIRRSRRVIELTIGRASRLDC